MLNPYTKEEVKYLRDLLDGMPPDEWRLMFPQGIHRLMTGIERVGINGVGLIKARYEDGAEKEKKASAHFLDLEVENLTALSFASELVD